MSYFQCCFPSNQVLPKESIMSGEDFEDHERVPNPAQMETDSLLEELRPLISPDLYRCVEKAADDYKQKIPGDINNMNALIRALKENEAISSRKDKRKDCEGGGYSKYDPRRLLASMKSPEKVKVFPVVAAKTFGADKAILKEVNVEVCANPADCDVVVVFCPIVSRIGSDVDDAMRKIPDGASTKQVILVMMHHSRKDITPTEAQLNHGHQNVISDVHVVYHETKNGLITCETNDQAIQYLKDFRKNFISQKDNPM